MPRELTVRGNTVERGLRTWRCTRCFVPVADLRIDDVALIRLVASHACCCAACGAFLPLKYMGNSSWVVCSWRCSGTMNTRNGTNYAVMSYER